MLPELRGDTVALIGGGPSLKGFDWTPLRESGLPVITVNNAWKLFPKALAAFFADARWWRLNGATLTEGFDGAIITTAIQQRTVDHNRLIRLRRDFNSPLALDPGFLAGLDSGTMAVNLAYHMGARRIILFGYDMTFTGEASHWHSEHIWPTSAKRYETMFAPKLSAMVEDLKTRGVFVTRATEPGIAAAPYRALEVHTLLM